MVELLLFRGSCELFTLELSDAAFFYFYFFLTITTYFVLPNVYYE